jgi:membrane-bound lytic murein transglycosylase B
MHDGNRHRHAAWPHVARRAATLMTTVGLLVSCSAQEALDRENETSPTAGGSQTSTGRATDRPSPPTRQPTDELRGGLPTVPPTRDAAALARQVDQAAATLRDRDATAADLRRAAEFQQLAVRSLATSSGAFRREATTRMRPETVRLTRGDVKAARLLHALGEPQRTLPRWRIVAPPPAEELLRYYKEAERRTGVPWTYLAAIHLVETRMGRIRGTSTAGALGPMQFLPSTWESYGAGGDIDDPHDAILAAARLLKDHGAPRDMAAALWHYNPSDQYVRAVSEHARTMERSRAAYRGYWHWRVLYRHTRGTYVLPVGYPDARPVLLRDR